MTASRPLLVYFHGMPGTGEELELPSSNSWQADISFFLPDRHGTNAANFDAIAASLSAQFPDRHLHFVGFSMGCFVALQVAARLGDIVGRIDLISSAAPLECGNFLPAMAGRQVFAAACRSPFQFHLLVQIQALLAIVIPSLLHRILFKDVTGAERKLANDPKFKVAMRRMTRITLFRNRLSYNREILAYVKPWSAILSNIRAKTVLWHGADDTWTPLSMAHALAAKLPNVVAVNIMPGLAHYSCLVDALPLIAASVAKARLPDV